MKYLQFDVKNMAVSRSSTDKTVITSGAVGYYGVEITFDEEFAEIPGTKAVEFYKDKHTYKRDLLDNKCAVPNEVLKDAKSFDIRVLSGSTVATSWQSVSVTESGVISEESADTPAPAGYEYVKTPSGTDAVPYFRAGAGGLEYSTDGTNYVAGLEGVQDVPATPSGQKYLRENGAWVEYEEVEGLDGTAAQLQALDTGETDTATIVAKINEIVGVLQTRGISLS